MQDSGMECIGKLTKFVAVSLEGRTGRGLGSDGLGI